MDLESVKNAVNLKDEVGRGIFHYLSKAPAESAFNEICKTLIDKYNLDPNEVDDEGNSPIMLACMNGKEGLVKVLELFNCSIKDTNLKNENCLHLMFKEKGVKKINRSLCRYLLEKGVDINALYEEPDYQKDKDEENSNENAETYKCTPLIHLIRTERLEVWDKGSLIDDLIDKNPFRFDPNQPDSEGKDIFMHLAIQNEFDL